METAKTYICPSCNESLARNYFQKKEFNKQNGEPPICHYCKKRATAGRTKQPLPKIPMERQMIMKQNNNNNNAAAETSSSTMICSEISESSSTANMSLCLVPKSSTSSRYADSGLRRRPNNFGYCNYIDHLFSLKCFPDIVNLKVFTTAKDVSESMAAIHAASRHGIQLLIKSTDNKGDDDYNKNSSNDDVLCLCIGDGSTPRTAVLAAFLKGWNCISIDPNLALEWHGPHPSVRNLTGYVGTIESFVQDLQQQQHEREGNNNNNNSNPQRMGRPRHLILLCVHSHAQFRNTCKLSNIRALYGSPLTTLVSIPCCPKFRHVKDIGRNPDVKYDDDCIFSACRTVYVWNEIEGESNGVTTT